MTFDLLSMRGSGSGTSSFDLKRLTPSAATMNVRSETTMEAANQQMRMNIDVAVEMKGK